MKIEWTSKAARQLEKLKDHKLRASIFDEVETLSNFPHCRNVKALTNHAYDYRLRVGRYRIFFKVYTKIEIVEVHEVKKRDETTY